MDGYRQYQTEYSLLYRAGRTVYLSALMMLCFYSALWMIQDIFPDWQMPGHTIKYLCICVILTAAVYEMGIQALPWGRKLCRLLPPLFYATAGYRYIRLNQIDFEDGLCAFGTQFLEKYNKQMRTGIIIWKGKPELLGMAFAVCMYGIVLALLILTLISNRNIYMLLLPAFVLGAELFIGYAPQWRGLSCFFASVIAASAAELWHWHIIPSLCTAAVVLVILAGSSVIFKEPAARFLEQAPKARAFQKNLEQNLKANIESVIPALFERSRVNVQNDPPQYTGREVMKITASKEPAEDLFLKSFYGTEYQDGIWLCDRQAFADACQQAGYSPQRAAEELLQAGYDVLLEGLGRMYDSLSETLPEESGVSKLRERLSRAQIDYTLEYTGIRNQYAYVPYLADLSQGSSEKKLSGDSVVQKSWRQKKTEVSGLDYIDNYLIQFTDEEQREIFQWYDAFADDTYVKGSEQIPAVWEYVEHINSAETGFVIPGEKFLDILDNAQVWMEQTGRAGRNQGRLFLAGYIGMLLKQTLQYSMDLPPLPAGEDAVRYFLSESHKGYCVHFASAAVLMLRREGVPARYASGYVVRREDFYESGDVYCASVKDSAAHAWVEVYLDGIGWIPVDVTPGDSAHMADGQQTDSQENGNQDNQENTRPDDTDTDDTDTDDTKPDTDTDDTKTDDAADDTRPGDTQTGKEQTGYWPDHIIRLVFLAAGLAGWILLLHYAVRSAARMYQNVLRDELRAGKNRSAVLRINRRLYKKLMIRRKMTDAEYEQVLKEAFPDVSEKDWARYMQIVQAAVFAGEEPDADDAQFCYHIYRNL